MLKHATVILVAIGNVALALSGVYSGRIAAVLSTVALSAYAITRGLNQPNPQNFGLDDTPKR